MKKAGTWIAGVAAIAATMIFMPACAQKLPDYDENPHIYAEHNIDRQYGEQTSETDLPGKQEEHISAAPLPTDEPADTDYPSTTAGASTPVPTAIESAQVLTSTPTPTPVIDDGAIPPADYLSVLHLLPATTVVNVEGASKEDVMQYFTIEEISDDVFARMKGKSFGEGCTIERAELRYLRVLHYNFDGEVAVGELVVNAKIADTVISIFKELYEAKYKIERMVLVDNFNADDELSMQANNTSSFNFRVIEGSTQLSYHAYGLAIDINPLYNPYIKTRNGETLIFPATAEKYADRSADCEYYILKNDICYKIFTKYGFTWGGDWTTAKDYQHFEISVD